MAVQSGREQQLRELIQKKPKNGRAIAELSSLLFSQSKEAQDPKREIKLRDEAIDLAKQSISVAPTKPFGQVALSTASRDPTERLECLTKAIDATSDQQRPARIGLLLRALIEPRDLQAREVKGKIGKASSKHPNRKALTAKEKEIYERIQNELEIFRKSSWSSATVSEKELISQHEFRLGQFFRKKEPRTSCAEYSRQHFRNCQQYSVASDFEMAGFWLATLENDGADDAETTTTTTPTRAPLRCPKDYVVGLYSTFAADFDTLLVKKLQYQTPQKIRRLFDREVGTTTTAPARRRCCDLGCGTGLSGLAFQSAVTSMVGIDLSPEMLEQAKTRQCYESLHVGDIDVTLQILVDSACYQDNPFDLILAADVFCYIGALESVFRAVRSALFSGGYFCFSTELLAEANEPSQRRPFLLHGSARFCHAKYYIEELAKEYSFEFRQLETADIRKNQGKGVKGLLVVLKKM